MLNEKHVCLGDTDIDEFVKSQGWKWFSNIRGISTYTAEDTYYEDNKLYNLVIRRRNYFIKQKNGLKVYHNNGGYYINTIFGRVYVNGLCNGKEEIIPLF